MGARGPRPLPANVHRLRDNASHKPLASLLDDVVRPEVAIPRPPKGLSGEALREWKRIAPHLQRLGLISHIDRAALTAYCRLHARIEHAEAKIAELNEADPAGEAGYVAVKPSGMVVENRWLKIVNDNLALLKAYLEMFGMSPAARSRVTASDPQIALPGLEKPQEGGWGAFPNKV